MKIKILGPSCQKCSELEDVTRLALDELKLAIPIEKITDRFEIKNYGVSTTPALVVNDKVLFLEKVPLVNEVKEILKNL